MYMPSHWHETHDEIHRVLKGKMEFTVNGVTKVYGPEDGELYIPKGVVHLIKSLQGIETIFEERTTPMDEEKEIFFRNLCARGSMTTSPLETMQVFWYGDTYIALPGGFHWLGKLFVKILGYYLAPILGYRRAYENMKGCEPRNICISVRWVPRLI